MSLFARMVLGLDERDRPIARDQTPRGRPFLHRALQMRLDPRSLPIFVSPERIDMGRGPLVLDCSVWRYGTQQFTVAEPEDGWYAGWPAYTEIEDAWDSYYYYELDERTRHPRKYNHRIIAYPPEPPPFVYRLR